MVGRLATLLLTAFGGVLAACGDSNAPARDIAAPAAEPAVVAHGFDVGLVRAPAEYLAEPQFAGADLERGELLSLACAACHHFRAEQGTLVGPNLAGVFGRRAARLPGFVYSAGLAATELVWTPVALEAWLANPAGFVPGTTMAFAGYRSAEDRRDLIAYLLKITDQVP